MLVTISGFGTGSSASSDASSDSSAETPGVHKMAGSKKIGGKVKGSKHMFDWDATTIADTIELGVKEDPCQRVVIIGHSLGGDTADEVCEELKERGICVDLLIQIESVGNEDDTTPSNVEQGVNIFSVGADFPDGEEWVDGSINIGVKGSSHTGIDQENDAGKVTQAGTDYDDMSAWDAVEHFIDKLPEKGVNKKLANSQTSLSSENATTLLSALAQAENGQLSLGQLHRQTEMKSENILPTLAILSKLDLVDVTGDLGMDTRITVGSLGRALCPSSEGKDCA